MVTSDGKVLSGSILNSKISAKDNIVVTSGKGVILGGELKTCTHIIAQIAGSERARIDTLLEIRADAFVTEQFDAARKELLDMRGKLKDLRQAWNVIQQKISAGETFPPEKAELVDVLRNQISLLESEIKNQTPEYIRLKAEIEKCDWGRIVIQNSIYEGAKIVISNTSYYVRNSMPCCQFIKEGCEIKVI